MMDRDRIKGRVKIKLEEMSEASGQIVENPMIDEILDETADELQLLVPRYLLVADTDSYNDEDAEHVVNADGSGYVVLPDTFLRLSYFKMEEWIKPVFDAISENHPAYVNQHNPFTRGKPAKPICVIRYDAELSKYILEYFSVTAGSTHTVEKAAFILKKTAEELQDDLIDPLTWLVAAKVLQIYSTDEKGEQKCRDRVADWIKLHTL
jgi:hypothetical protein